MVPKPTKFDHTNYKTVSMNLRTKNQKNLDFVGFPRFINQYEIIGQI